MILMILKIKNLSFFSEKDNYWIIWKINNDYEIPSLNLFKKIAKNKAKINISIFGMFSKKKYSNKENYIFIYDKDWSKNISQIGIYYYKINSNFNIIPNKENYMNYSLIADKSNIKYLVTYYDENNIINGKLYLLNYNKNKIIVYEDIIGNNLNEALFKS